MQPELTGSRDGAAGSVLAQRICLLVLGMHRSGTSAMTRLISLLGADLPKTLLGEGLGNERGHWEPVPLVAHHDRLLKGLGSRWDDWRKLDMGALAPSVREEAARAFHALIEEEYAASPLFVLKEPRICRFAPFVVELLADRGIAARHILVLRNPLAVAASLQERDGMTPGFAALVWLRHVLDAEAATRHAPRALVSYENLMLDWRAAMRSAGARLGIRWPCPIEVSGPQVEAFLSAELQHHAPSRHELAGRADVADWVKVAYGALRALERDADDEAACATLDAIAAAFDAVAPTFAAAMFPELAARDRRVAEREAEQARVAEEVRVALGLREADVAALRGEVGARRAEVDVLLAENGDLRLQIGTRIAELEAGAAAHSDVLRLRAETGALSEKLRDAERALIGRGGHILKLEAEQRRFSSRLGRQIGRARERFAPQGTLWWRLSNWVAKQILYQVQRRGMAKFASQAQVPRAVFADVGETIRHEPNQVPRREMVRPFPAAEPHHYQCWISAHEMDEIEPSDHSQNITSYKPLISVILPIYKVPNRVLEATLESLRAQTYPNWQACIAYADTDDDANWKLVQRFVAADSRCVARRLDRNEGIAANSNECLKLAEGEYIALLDHDDLLSHDAFHRIVNALNIDPTIDFLYSDKDSIVADGSLRMNPLFKPSWSPEMLYSVNYLTHLNVIRTALVVGVGGFRPETDGAQDWDLFLRVTEMTDRIRRVDGVLYHWRVLPTSTSTGIAAKPYAIGGQLRAVNDHLRRRQLDAEAVQNEETGFKIAWRRKVGNSRFIVVRHGSPDGLSKCLKVILRQRSGAAEPIAVVIPSAEWSVLREFLVHDYGSVPDGVEPHFAEDGELAQTVLNLLCHPSSSEATALVNSNVVDATEGCIGALCNWVTCHPEVGFASAVTLGMDERVIEAGSVLDAADRAFPLFRGERLRSWGIFGGPLWHRNVRAASPYMLAFKTSAITSTTRQVSNLSWQHAVWRMCRVLHEGGLRGVVDPTVRVSLAPGTEFPAPLFDPSVGHDPYFHPAFASVAPLLLRAELASSR